MKIKALSTLLVIAGLTSAQAANTTYTAGDAFIAFRSTSAVNNVEVKLGAASTLTNTSAAAGTLLDFSNKLSVTDLVNTYGSNWASSSTKFATFAAPNKSLATNVWLGAARADALTQTTAFTQQSSSTQGGWINNINDFNGTTTGLAVSYKGRAENGTLAGTYIADSTKTGSYTIESNISGFFFGVNGVSLATAEKTAVGSTDTIDSSWALIDFYNVRPTGGAVSYLGTFGLALADTTTANGASYAAGTLLYEFNGASQFVAIPEPSTYAMILGALTVGFVSLRRRFSRAV